MITEFLSAWLGRVLAIWIAALAAWLLVHFGIAIPVEARTKLVEALVGVVIPILISLYAIVHKLIDRKLNPGDAAAPQLVANEKIEHAAALRRTRVGG